MLVLVVDDDNDDQVCFRDAVKQIDPAINLISAWNGEEALTYLHTRAVTFPDYVFLDINMPRIDGRKCLAAIRQHNLTKNLPVIMYSTSLSDADKLLFNNLNARFLTKASSYDQLVASLRQIFGTLKNEFETPISFHGLSRPKKLLEEIV